MAEGIFLNISDYYAREAFNSSIYSNKTKSYEEVEEDSKQFLEQCIDSRNFSKRLIFESIKGFSENIYSESKFIAKLNYLAEKIEIFELGAIKQLKNVKKKYLPDYLKSGSEISVGSGLYLSYKKHFGRIICHYCGFSISEPKILEGSKVKTLISSDNELFLLSYSRVLDLLNDYFKKSPNV